MLFISTAQQSKSTLCVCVCVCVCLHTYVYCVLSHSVMSNSAAHYCSPPGFSVHRIFQERILEWAAISSSRVSSHPRDSTRVSYISGRFFTLPATRKACVYKYPSSLDFFPFRSPQSIEQSSLGYTVGSHSVQFNSVAQSCLALCGPKNYSKPGLPVHHQLPEFTQTHLH